MTTETRLHYDIDNDISVEMTTSGNLCYVSIYNDRNNKSNNTNKKNNNYLTYLYFL